MPLTLYFSSHEEEALADRFLGLFADSEMVVVECSFSDGADDVGEERFNALARGQLTPSDFDAISENMGHQPFSAFDRKLKRTIHRSMKRIFIEHSPLGVLDAIKYGELAEEYIQAVTVDEACRQLRENLAKRSKYERSRDDALASQLAELSSQHPSNKILVVRGSGHERALEKALNEHHITFSAFRSHEPLLLDLETEAMAKLTVNEEPSREELLMVLLERVEIGDYESKTHRPWEPIQANIGAMRVHIMAMSAEEREIIVERRLRGA